MKKICVLLVMLFAAQVTFADTVYTINGNNRLYSNSSMRYSKIPKFNQSRTNSQNSEALGALLAGAGLATGRLSLLSTPEISNSNQAFRTFLDPYIVMIKDKNYVLVTDSKDNNWTVQNILGYNDNKSDMFLSLKQLESDGNADKITEKDLQKANIRFVRLNDNGSLALNDRSQDFDIKKVQYIDMKNLRTALGNKNQDGTFGYFYVVIKEGVQNRAYPGRVTFEEKEELNKYIK